MRLITASVVLMIVAGIYGCRKKATNPRSSSPPAIKSPWPTIGVGKGPDAMFLVPGGRHLYVANVGGTTISVIDTGTDRVVKQISVSKNPWGFVRLGRGHLVAVSCWAKALYVIDTRTHAIVRSRRYPQKLGGIVATADGRWLFVVATGKNQVLKLDATTLSVVDTYATDPGPDGIGLSADETKVYTANTKAGSVSIIRLADKSSKRLTFGGKPELIHSNHSRTLLYISNFRENVVHVVSTVKDDVVHTIKDLKGPEDAVLSADGKTLYVVNFSSSRVFSYDSSTYLRRPGHYVVGRQPIGLVHAPTVRKLYVSNYGSASVSVIRLEPPK